MLVKLASLTLWKMGPKRSLSPWDRYKVIGRSSSVRKLWHNWPRKECDVRGMVWDCSYRWGVAWKSLKEALILHGKSDWSNTKKGNFCNKRWKRWSFVGWAQEESSPSRCNREMENMSLSLPYTAAASKMPRTLLTSMDLGLGTIKCQEDMVTFLKLLSFKLRK